MIIQNAMTIQAYLLVNFSSLFLVILLNPLPAKFLKWNNPLSIFGTVHYHFLRISRWELEAGQPTVYSLVRLHRCAGWPGSILVAKTNHFWFQQNKGYHYLIQICNSDYFYSKYTVTVLISHKMKTNIVNAMPGLHCTPLIRKYKMYMMVNWL